MAFLLLQLSDIHFTTRHNDDSKLHDDVQREFLTDLHKLREELGRSFDAIAITGDIAFAGKRSDYEVAARWLDQVVEICGCAHTAVLTVPGNHDVDRGRIHQSATMVHRRLRSAGGPTAQSEFLSLANSGDPVLLDKFQDYQAFAACYGTRFASAKLPSWTRRFQLSGRSALDVVGLSTVSVCDAEDEVGAMFLGSHQYVVGRNPNVETIVLMHHPVEWLKDKKEAEQFLSSRAKVLIYGHEHIQKLRKIEENGYERLILGSGALTPENAHHPYTYRYNALSFEHGTKEGAHSLDVTVFPRVWGEASTAFEPDYSACSGKVSKTFELRSAQFGQPQPTPAVQKAAPKVPALETAMPCSDVATLKHYYWRYLEWRTRIKVLLRISTLPPAPEAPLPPEVEAAALDEAESRNKLRELWDLVMEQLPELERVRNPFPEV